VDDDRGRPVYRDIDLHVPRGGVLVLYGAGKTALLYTLGGRVTKLKGDLKVLGRVLPQHGHALRREVTVIGCKDGGGPAGEVASALADDIELALVDDADLVLRTDERDALRDLINRRRTRDGRPATFVLTCQDPDRLADLLPADARLFALSAAQPVEVR
jgi:RND superfamily putative drug exporter